MYISLIHTLNGMHTSYSGPDALRHGRAEPPVSNMPACQWWLVQSPNLEPLSSVILPFGDSVESSTTKRNKFLRFIAGLCCGVVLYVPPSQSSTLSRPCCLVPRHVWSGRRPGRAGRHHHTPPAAEQAGRPRLMLTHC